MFIHDSKNYRIYYHNLGQDRRGGEGPILFQNNPHGDGTMKAYWNLTFLY